MGKTFIYKDIDLEINPEDIGLIPIEKIPYPLLNVHFIPKFYIKRDRTNLSNYAVMIAGYKISCWFGNYEIFSLMDFDNLRLQPYGEYYAEGINKNVKVDLNAIKGMEKLRKDDTVLTFKFSGLLTISYDNIMQIYHFNADSIANIKLSENEWLKLLEDIGYSKKWIITIDSPDIEGFENIKKYLNGAFEFIVKNQPSQAIQELRKCWDSLPQLLDKNWEDIAKEINKGSVSNKSDKIKEIKKGIRDFTNIGPHSEVYPVSMEDAKLLYRLTISMLSYLAPFMNNMATF